MAEPTPRRRARLARAGLAAALGAVAALGQAPFGLWPATLAGLAGGYVLLARGGGTKRAALTGWAFGTGYFGLTLVWIVQPFLVEPEVYGWMAPFGLLFMAGGMGLFWGAGFAGARALAPTGRFGWLAFAVALSAAELARASVLTGFPWGAPGQALIGIGLAQLASLVGAYGLTVASFAAGAALGDALLRRSLWPGALALGLLAAGWGLGAALARAPLPERAEPVTLRLIQPNAPQHLKWDPDWIWVFFDRAGALSAEPPAPGAAAPDLVIWPESSIPSYLGDVPAVEQAAVEAAAPARLVAGIERRDGARVYNSLAVFGPDGKVEALYDKHHIVPFGEFVPMGDLLEKLGIHGMAARSGNGFSAGPGAQVIHLADHLGTALPLICYEAIFPRDLRAAPERADWILQVTNDAWFGTFSGPQQHLVQARFRAIEMGLPFVRAANTGISAVIDAHGEVLAQLPLGTAGKLDAGLPGALPPTLYAQWGDAPTVLLLILAAAGLILVRRPKAVDRTRPGR